MHRAEARVGPSYVIICNAIELASCGEVRGWTQAKCHRTRDIRGAAASVDSEMEVCSAGDGGGSECHILRQVEGQS
jgi:hypothetical protein